MAAETGVFRTPPGCDAGLKTGAPAPPPPHTGFVRDERPGLWREAARIWIPLAALLIPLVVSIQAQMFSMQRQFGELQRQMGAMRVEFRDVLRSDVEGQISALGDRMTRLETRVDAHRDAHLRGEQPAEGETPARPGGRPAGTTPPPAADRRTPRAGYSSYQPAQKTRLPKRRAKVCFNRCSPPAPGSGCQ